MCMHMAAFALVVVFRWLCIMSMNAVSRGCRVYLQPDVANGSQGSRSSETWEASSGHIPGRTIEILHPPDGSWFSVEPVLCPLLKATSSEWLPCSFSMRIRHAAHTAAGEAPADTASWIRVLVDRKVYWPRRPQDSRRGGSEEEEEDSLRDEESGTYTADQRRSGAYETRPLYSSEKRARMLNLPIRLFEEGWHTLQVELCQDITNPAGDRGSGGGGGGAVSHSEFGDGRSGDACRQLISVAEAEVEVVTGREAELRRRDLLTWCVFVCMLGCADSVLTVVSRRFAKGWRVSVVCRFATLITHTYTHANAHKHARTHARTRARTHTGTACRPRWQIRESHCYSPCMRLSLGRSTTPRPATVTGSMAHLPRQEGGT